MRARKPTVAKSGNGPTIEVPKNKRHRLNPPAVEVRPGIAATPTRGPPLVTRAYRIYWPSTVVTDFQKKLAVSQGEDPNSVPDLPYRNLRLPAVCALLGVSQSALYRMIEKGLFPRGKPIDMPALEAAAKVVLPSEPAANVATTPPRARRSRTGRPAAGAPA
jgi:hypothetical protein